MASSSIGASAGLLLRTYPFLLLRIVIYFGIAAAFVVAGSGGAGIGSAIGSLIGRTGQGAGAFWGALTGFACVVFLLRWLREYFLYLVQTGHLAALMLVLDRRNPPRGVGQVGHAIGIVQQRYRDMTTLVAIDRLTRAIVAGFLGRIDLAVLVAPGIASLLSPVSGVLRPMLLFLADVIPVHALRTAANRPWPATRDAIVLLVQNQSALLPYAAVLSAVASGLTAVAFLILLMPAIVLAHDFPGGSTLVGIVLAAAFAWCVRQALIVPAMIASMLPLYLEATERQSAEPDWDAKLSAVSAEFRELKSRTGPSRRDRTV
jgi:hypothetical protein